MDISVIICTYNRCESLGRALSSLAALEIPSGVHWEVVVVDNNSRDATRDVCLKFESKLPLRYVFEAAQGQSYAMNRGVSETSAAMLFFTDDDVELDPLWAAALWTAAREHPEISFFGGRVLPLWDCPLPRWIRECDCGSLNSVFVHYDLGADTRTLLGAHDRLFMGANFAVRRSVFDAGHRFDDRMGPQGRDLINGSETQLELALLRGGLKGLYVPGAVVHHCNPRERMAESYLRRYFKGMGMRETRLEGITTDPTLCGAPRWLWRRVVIFALRYCRARILSPPKVWVGAEIEMAKTWGHVCEWRRQARLTNCGGRPRPNSIRRRGADNRATPDAKSIAGTRRRRVGILLADHGTTLGGGPIGLGRVIEEMDRARWEFFIYTRGGMPVQQMVRDPEFLSIRRFDSAGPQAETWLASGRASDSVDGARIVARLGAGLARVLRGVWHHAPVALKRHVGLRVDSATLLRMISEDAIDILYCLSGPEVLSMRVGRLPCRLVVRYSSAPPTFRVPRRYSRALRRCFDYADAVITCSEACRLEWREYLRRPVHRMKVVHNGIDTREFDLSDRPSVRASFPFVSEGPIIGAVGRLADEKGFDVLIRAMTRVLAVMPTVHLAIVGDGAYRPVLESLARELGVQQSVHFMGWRQDAARLNLGFDVAVVPSVWSEPFGIVLLEAMAAGTPVVASRVGGIPEVVVDGETGWLVSPGNADELATAIVQALDNPVQLRAMGLAARRHVGAHFSLDANRKAHERLFEDLLRDSISQVHG